MDKFSQSKRQTGRGILNEIREMVNIPGSYVEGFFKPELDRVMNALKGLDDRIRSQLTGKKIGTAEAPQNPMSAKDLLKSARSNFNRREYMAGIADLGVFHKKMYDISQDINRFYVDVNKIHNKFLFEGLDESQKEKFKQLREHMENRASDSTSEYFIKEAGVMDFFHNIGTERGRSLMAWEKKYPKQTKELREGGLRLIESAEGMLANVISALKEMATARAIRRPDDYMEAAQKIKKEFDRFDISDKGFKAYYNNTVVPVLKIKDEIESKEQANATKPVVVPTTQPTDKVELGGPIAPGPITPPLGGPPGASPPFTPPAPEENGPDTERNIPIPLTPKPPGEVSNLPAGAKVRVAASHQKFLQSLEAMSGEDPRILTSFISKYAASIKDQDPETAITLIALVKKLKE